MNLFWQITLIEFLLNVAVFVSAVIFYDPIRIFGARLSKGHGGDGQSSVRALFGIATAAARSLLTWGDWEEQRRHKTRSPPQNI